MKRIRASNKLFFVLFVVIAVSFAALVFNIKVTRYQGRNYNVCALEIPLFLKILDFFDRHYHYKLIAQRIAEDSRNEEEKALKIFEWTHKNIKKTPKDFPIIDDHVYNIIIRGYGTDDQSADVFTTLCVYAGIAAFWTWVSPADSKVQYAVSFVKFEERWLVFDSFAGNYFRNKEGEIASVEDIIRDLSIVDNAANKPVIYGVDYVKYFESLSPINEKVSLRAKMHMPWPRIIFELKKRLGIAN